MTNKIKEVKHQSQTNYFSSPELLMHTCFKTHLLFCNLPLSDSELAAYVSRKTMTSEKLIEATRMLLFPYSSSCKLTLKCCYDHNQVTVGFLCVLNEYLTCQDSKLTVVKVDLVSDSYCSYQPKFKHHSKCQWEWFVWLFSFFSTLEWKQTGFILVEKKKCDTNVLIISILFMLSKNTVPVQ